MRVCDVTTRFDVVHQRARVGLVFDEDAELWTQAVRRIHAFPKSPCSSVGELPGPERVSVS